MKRQFKSQASSGRVGGAFGSSGFGSTKSSSTLSYIQEPLDYTLIGDSNVVVAFKNLAKKDATTKAKALEDLQVSLLAENKSDLNDAVLEAWVRLFPRLSIDNARRVRQLAHTLNGHLCSRCGKRVAKHLKQLSGPWLAGVFDSDRAVGKAASDALTAVFPTQEKVGNLRRTFQESILQYCQEALLEETVQTLSDERVVSSDDAEATYARVLASSMAVISSLLEHLQPDEISKQSHSYDMIFSEKKLWKFTTHTDSSVRRAMHRLVRVCVHKHVAFVSGNLKLASNAYISHGLSFDQTGSTTDYAQTLSLLTRSLPLIWSDAYNGGKSAISRLRQCIKNGSRSGSAGFWDAMMNVFRNLPTHVLPTSYDEIVDLLAAAKDGVTKREERLNAASSWPAYFTIIDVAAQPLSDGDCEKLLEVFALPPVRQYVCPSEKTAQWTVAGTKAAPIVSKISLVRRIAPVLETQWESLADQLIELAKTSLPEQSKDFDASQKQVGAAGERFANLQKELLNEEAGLPESIITIFLRANVKILKEHVDLLRTRNGKPYGAAASIEHQLRACAPLLLPHEGYRAVLVDFIVNDLPLQIRSPSQKYLVRCLYALTSVREFSEAFQKTLETILESKEPDTCSSKVHGLAALFAPGTPRPALELAQASSLLRSFLIALSAGSVDAAATELLCKLLEVGAVSHATSDEILANLTNALSLSGPVVQASLAALEKIAATNERAVKEFMAGSNTSGESLLPSVLRLEQSSEDTTAEMATLLSARLTSAMGSAASGAKYSVILRNLEEVSTASLPIDAVLDLLSKIGPEDFALEELLPSMQVFCNAVAAVVKAPRVSLGLLSPLGGAVHLAQSETSEARQTAQYDGEGLSQAARIAMYLARVLNRSELPQSAVSDVSSALALMSICVLLAQDTTSIAGANDLWKPTEGQALEPEIMDFVVDANAVLRLHSGRLASISAPEQAHLFSAIAGLQERAEKYSPLYYYAALAAVKAHQNDFELHGYTTGQTATSGDRLKALRAAKDPLVLTSYIVGYSQPLAGSQSLARTCNELVADITALDINTKQQEALESLVVLNAILHTQEDIVAAIAKNRLLFLVKRAVSWLEMDCPLAVKAEVCRGLTKLLPGMADIYGEIWEQIIGAVINFCNSSIVTSEDATVSDTGVLLAHGSLKLLTTLQKLGWTEDVSDDLVETMKDCKDSINGSLTTLLLAVGSLPDENHKPLMVTNELLERLIVKLPVVTLEEAEGLFPLLYAPSWAVQGAAFDLLHKYVPAAQEQISFDAALEDKAAHLPDELLSLIINAPTLDSLADASFLDAIPLPLQGYLNSWRVLFDHFSNSSYRVKSDYVEQLKEGGYLTGLLDLTFDFLQLTRGRPVDASKFNVTEYTPRLEEKVETDVQWLLTHLYYLTLSNLPSLVKTYILDMRSRTVPQAVETWTAKYISPLIISSSLQDVADWAEKSVKDDPDYENMTVKVGLRSREISAGYMVDEQVMAIRVTLPEAYPLDAAKVTSVNRVAVKEEKWQSWLRNCQGVIMFSNGSITDALTAWRKNVSGTLKGQTECAICYSIISGAKELPTKRCTTCKNLFHSGCLFKWFKSSNASTCPLCRNAFNFN